jgi:hypothetical protein
MNRTRVATAIFWIGIVVIACFLFFASRPFGPNDKAVRHQMKTVMKSLVDSYFISGRTCSEAQIEAMGNKELDAWERPFKTAFRNGTLDLQSAGPDGTWNTQDDFHCHAIVGEEKTTAIIFRGPCSNFEFPNEPKPQPGLASNGGGKPETVTGKF